MDEVKHTTKVTSEEDESYQEPIDEPQMDSSSEDSDDAEEEVYWDSLEDEAERSDDINDEELNKTTQSTTK